MYTLELVKEKVKRNQVVAFHLIAAIILMIMGFITFVTPFSLNIYQAGKENTQFVEMNWVHYVGLLISLIGLSIIIITIFFNRRFIQDKKNLIIRIIEILCFLPILAYCLYNKWYLPATYSGAALIGICLAYIFEKNQEKNRIIEINNQGILLKTSSKNTKWNWEELEHFIIKHNVLTLRTTDKKLFQFIFLINKEVDYPKINQFAIDNIQKAIPNRRNDDW